MAYLEWRQKYYKLHLFDGYFKMPPKYDFKKTEELAMQREIMKPTFADVGFSELDVDLLRFRENARLSKQLQENLHDILLKHLSPEKIDEMMKVRERNLLVHESVDKGLPFTKCFPLGEEGDKANMFKDAHIANDRRMAMFSE